MSKKDYLEIYVGKQNVHNWRKVQEFLQMMVNRLVVGGYRYGNAKKEQKYYSRLKAELKAYKKTRCKEHLVNLSNYAHLESIAPELDGSHWNNRVDSVTRKIFGGERE